MHFTRLFALVAALVAATAVVEAAPAKMKAEASPYAMDATTTANPASGLYDFSSTTATEVDTKAADKKAKADKKAADKQAKADKKAKTDKTAKPGCDKKTDMPTLPPLSPLSTGSDMPTLPPLSSTSADEPSKDSSGPYDLGSPKSGEAGIGGESNLYGLEPTKSNLYNFKPKSSTGTESSSYNVDSESSTGTKSKLYNFKPKSSTGTESSPYNVDPEPFTGAKSSLYDFNSKPEVDPIVGSSAGSKSAYGLPNDDSLDMEDDLGLGSKSLGGYDDEEEFMDEEFDDKALFEKFGGEPGDFGHYQATKTTFGGVESSVPFPPSMTSVSTATTPVMQSIDIPSKPVDTKKPCKDKKTDASAKPTKAASEKSTKPKSESTVPKSETPAAGKKTGLYDF